MQTRELPWYVTGKHKPTRLSEEVKSRESQEGFSREGGHGHRRVTRARWSTAFPVAHQNADLHGALAERIHHDSDIRAAHRVRRSYLAPRARWILVAALLNGGVVTLRRLLSFHCART